MFSFVYNDLNIGTVVFLLPENESLISEEDVGPPPCSYIGPEQTNKALALDPAFCLCLQVSWPP